MNLNIVIALFTLFTGGHSLKCYSCISATGSCVGTKTTCSANLTTCASATLVSTNGTVTATTKLKGCSLPQSCGNGSANFGALRSVVSMQCCNTDLCNNKNVPDFNTNSPNGKQCYSCDGKSCSNKLNCLGTEDYCITAKVNMTSLPTILKGCISKSLCDAASQVTQGFLEFSCCQENLCNSAKSITQSFLLLSWSCFFYLFLHYFNRTSHS